MILIYIAILIVPWLSVLQLIISSLYFIYYWVGVCYYISNKSKLNGH